MDTIFMKSETSRTSDSDKYVKYDKNLINMLLYQILALSYMEKYKKVIQKQ